MGKFARIIYALELDNINDSQAFRDIIGYCLHLGITNKEIGNECGLSYTTIDRWAHGVSSPHPALRKILFQWLKPKVYALVAQW